jgi:hypothetical protein
MDLANYGATPASRATCPKRASGPVIGRAFAAWAKLIRLEIQRWAHHFHAMLRKDLFDCGFLAHRIFISKLRHLLEEILHAASRLKQNEHLPFAITNVVNNPRLWPQLAASDRVRCSASN